MSEERKASWWAPSSDSASIRVQEASNNYQYSKRPSSLIVAVFAAIFAFSSILVVGLHQSTNQPEFRTNEFWSIEYFTDIQTLNEGCTNVFAFGEPDNYGVIDTSLLPHENTASAYNRYLLGTSIEVGLTAGTFTQYNEAQAYYYDNSIPRHPMMIPVSGYMSNEGLSKNYNTPENFIPAEEALRTMYSGGIVVWYDPETPNVIEQVEQYVNEHPELEGKIYTVPWYYPWVMPNDNSFAISTWGMSMNCAGYSQTGFDEFLRVMDEYPYFAPDFPTPPVYEQEDGRGLMPITVSAAHKKVDREE